MRTLCLCGYFPGNLQPQRHRVRTGCTEKSMFNDFSCKAPQTSKGKKMRVIQDKIINLSVCVLSLALGVNTLVGQQQTGVLRGQLKDILGGVIPAATVTVINGNGVEKRTPTDGDGRYEVSSLLAGTYTVRVSREGFAPYENNSVVIVAGRTVTLDVAMMVGLKEENVTVSSAARNISVDPENNASAIIL